ncbi:hypothetical protein [Lewinella cohaerens]|uniref:hypothetical protein n=1 Tax=Lewinella cohaerens TaxID=70995 RepID=UPI000381EB81|nr:hypothetical protein [Lewinella cohaerens]
MSFLNDLFTLDVITITGEFKVKIDDRDETRKNKKLNVVDFDGMFKEIKGKTTSKADLRILAATRVEVDRDTTNFVASDLKDEEIPLVKMHFEAVSAAAEGRSAILARLRPGGRKGDETGATT